jgi:hypothetical protein
MAYVSSYFFDNNSRIGNDECCVDQNTIQNTMSANYTLENYFINDSTMKNPISLATSQPAVFYNGTQSVGPGGYNVNENSQLILGSIQTHPKCRIDLFQRPFATVPFLGRGSVDPILESQIQQGELVINKKSVSNISEKSYIKYSNTPMLDSLKKTITNPQNLVESEAADGWIRGGIPSRELTRDQSFYNSN